MGASISFGSVIRGRSCSGVLLRVREEVSVSSGMVENFFRTCLRAGRRMGLLEMYH